MRCELLILSLLPSLAATAQPYVTQPSIEQLIGLASITEVGQFDEEAKKLGFRYKNIVQLRREVEKDTAYIELIYEDARPAGPDPDLLGLLLVGGWTPKVYLSSRTDMRAAVLKYATEHNYQVTSACMALQDPRTSECTCWTNGPTVLVHCHHTPTPEGHAFALWAYLVTPQTAR
jgi:hypothetical protein